MPKEFAIPSFDTMPCLEDAVLTSSLLLINFREELVLVVVIPFIGVIYYFTMGHLVLVYMILL